MVSARYAPPIATMRIIGQRLRGSVLAVVTPCPMIIGTKPYGVRLYLRVADCAG